MPEGAKKHQAADALSAMVWMDHRPFELRPSVPWLKYLLVISVRERYRVVPPHDRRDSAGCGLDGRSSMQRASLHNRALSLVPRCRYRDGVARRSLLGRPPSVRVRVVCLVMVGSSPTEYDATYYESYDYILLLVLAEWQRQAGNRSISTRMSCFPTSDRWRREHLPSV